MVPGGAFGTFLHHLQQHSSLPIMYIVQHTVCRAALTYSARTTTACVRSIFSVNVLSTSGTHCLMMSVSTLFIGLDVVSCVLICLVILGIVLSLADFHFLLFDACY